MMKLYEKLNKFHGKGQPVKIKNDAGEEIDFTIYPLPTKYMPMLLQVQALNQKLVGADEKADYARLSKEEREELANLTKDMVTTTVAFSECVSEGILDYKDFDRGIPDETMNKVKGLVENMSMQVLGKFTEAIGKLNDTPLTGDSKKTEASQ